MPANVTFEELERAKEAVQQKISKIVAMNDYSKVPRDEKRKVYLTNNTLPTKK